MEDYRRIADRIAAAIADGRLGPGQRLPPQRAFARRHRIAASTAGRVYGELVRRGLVVGEVGRGTFVRAAAPEPAGRSLSEAAPAGAAPAVDLQLTYPSVPGQSELLAPVLAGLVRPGDLTAALRPAAATGTPAAREAAAALLATPGWRPAPDRLLFTGNARQAIAAVLASLVRPGGRVGVEELTYPLVKEIAGRLGIVLVPLATDEEGPCPDAVAAAHRSAPLSALYLQPTLHNPTTRTMGAERRALLARTVAGLGLPVVEDRVWSFLHTGHTGSSGSSSGSSGSPGSPDPLAAHAPGLVHVVDGLSKRVAPGLTAGLLAVPADRVGAVAAAVRSGGWSAGGLALEAAARWIADGTVARLAAAKRADAARRRRLLHRHLGTLAPWSDPHAYFAWWELPAPWRADTFTAAAAAHGVAVTPGPAFAVDPARTPDAVRLGLASAPEAELDRALRALADVVRGGTDGGPSGR
ncbi:PLP-dependent aminotransferase family protein [Streptomyces tropicalis]|uniref:PLP-dependent aminotransferase family protein n=1 Tax=Streptomyces tropicalis TaxID=3034234 RepID=A0ABT6A8T2_9ACTN|nr:PLP-dependent aminotransferase family protein [Streptomyces tropicalis]MDF3301046.1 PLP-dependent aminotransferase family protein [Streptomyces tropicalis]